MNHEAISVLMLAHNHEPYIRQAIESVMAQQCDVPFQLWIGEDGSSDHTRAVCFEMKSAHPDRIQVLTSDRPLGMHGNFSNLWKKSRGELVAFCEGDDYWCDPLKLQKQVGFFQRHPECSLCGTFTDIHSKTEEGLWEKTGQVRPHTIQSVYSFEEMIPSYMFHFSSVIVRRDAVGFPDWFQRTYCVDRPIYLLAAQNGMAGLIAETMSVYRLHSGGAWSTLDLCAKAERSIDLFERMIGHFPLEYKKTFRRALGGILWSYVGGALQSGDPLAARKVYLKCLRYIPLQHLFVHARQHIGVMVRVFLERREVVRKRVGQEGLVR